MSNLGLSAILPICLISMATVYSLATSPQDEEHSEFVTYNCEIEDYGDFIKIHSKDSGRLLLLQKRAVEVVYGEPNGICRVCLRGQDINLEINQNELIEAISSKNLK